MRGTLPKVLQRYAKKIEGVDDERGVGNGYWVYLQPGWIVVGDCHQIHEDNPTQCAGVMSIVEPCECAECCELKAKKEEKLLKKGAK